MTIISIGNNLTSDVIKKPIAMGADEIITCEDPLIEETDILGTSLILSKIIRKTGPYDIIFCGPMHQILIMRAYPLVYQKISLYLL